MIINKPIGQGFLLGGNSPEVRGDEELLFPEPFSEPAMAPATEALEALGVRRCSRVGARHSNFLRSEKERKKKGELVAQN